MGWSPTQGVIPKYLNGFIILEVNSELEQAREPYFPHRLQNGTGDHPASCPMGTRSSFSGSKAAGAWSWPLTSIYCWGQRMRGAITPLFNKTSCFSDQLKKSTGTTLPYPLPYQRTLSAKRTTSRNEYSSKWTFRIHIYF